MTDTENIGAYEKRMTNIDMDNIEPCENALIV
jgi:hypothetical protein